MTSKNNGGLLRPLTISQAKKDRDKYARDVIAKALLMLTNVELQVIADNRKQDFLHDKAREILHVRQDAAFQDNRRQVAARPR